MRLTKYDELPRWNYFSSLENTKVITTSSCEWYAEKCEIDFAKYKPEISPLLFERTVKADTLISLVKQDLLYGFMVVDIENTFEAKKWLNVNWPPIMQKAEIFYTDLPEWMRKLYKPTDFPKETIVQRMQGVKLLLHTSLVKFYLENGFYIKKLHKVYEYQGARCFAKVFKTVYEARVEATEKNDDMKATAVKLVSNSMYGSLLLVSILY